jgi:acyl-CoA synthetase (AMP-forming)/AMP-acid ligase II
LKFSEVPPRVRRLSSGLYRLGLRPRDTVLFFTRNVSLVNLLYLAVWRLNAVVYVHDVRSSSAGKVKFKLTGSV